MLRTRIATAILLLAVFLPGLFFLSQRDWALATALIAGVAAWEWAGLMGWAKRPAQALGAACALLGVALVLVFPWLPELGRPGAMLKVYGLAVIFWLFVVPLWLWRKWSLSGVLGILVGALVIFPAWLALVHLRLLGPEILLAALAVVWVADIAAYFFGKNFGRHKLAPAISPGKTWEGALGAGLMVIVYGFSLRHWLADDSGSPAAWLAGLILVTGVSILGDLFESLLKRRAGLKDSSQILPGHGGVLDRIDSLTSTLPLVALFWLLTSLHRAA